MSQQGFTGLADFPRDCDHLRALPVASWRRLTFVNFSPAAALPFAHQIMGDTANWANTPAGTTYGLGDRGTPGTGR